MQRLHDKTITILICSSILNMDFYIQRYNKIKNLTILAVCLLDVSRWFWWPCVYWEGIAWHWYLKQHFAALFLTNTWLTQSVCGLLRGGWYEEVQWMHIARLFMGRVTLKGFYWEMITKTQGEDIFQKHNNLHVSFLLSCYFFWGLSPLFNMMSILGWPNRGHWVM